MESGNQRMDYEDADVRHERTVSSVLNIRVLVLFVEVLNGRWRWLLAMAVGYGRWLWQMAWNLEL
ncbi:MAG: hypothetical protein J6K05_09130 [Bacteroidaceae bacterium]|nr:hypothetical protein [Bacteroidaceae bacterium]